jgi:hypothetical protein
MTDRRLEGVEPTALTCEQVDERDLEAAYLAGRLSEADGEAYEAHVFSCERCWAVLRTAQEVAAARLPAAGHARRRWLVPLALAAGIGALLVGTVWLSPNRQSTDPSALRGAASEIAVQLDTRQGAVAIRFGAVAGADQYRIRLFSGDGELLEERTTSDTSLTLTPAGAGSARGPSGLLLEVAALDPLLEVLASSGLVPVEPPPPSR